MSPELSPEIRDYLLGLGADPKEIPDDVGMAAQYGSDLVFSRTDELDLHQLIERVGLDPDEDLGALRHLGIRIDDPNKVQFNDDDVEMVKLLFGAINDFMSEEEGGEILRVMKTALTTIAEAGIASHVQNVEVRAITELDMVRTNAEMSELGLALGPHLGTAFRHLLRRAIARQRQVQSLDHRAVNHLAVGFVDLVGFTALSHRADPGSIVKLVNEFESRAHELASEHDARVVKLIGDEVMFAAIDPDAAARLAVDLVGAFADDDVIPRGGLAAGELVTLHGDYFGPVVNLAARLVDEAVPGEVLMDAAMIDEVTSLAHQPAGRRMLKGFDQPVAVATLVSG